MVNRPAPTPTNPQFTAIADHALLVEFGETIDDASHQAVLALDAALAAQPCKGMAEAIPAYCNLLVEFDPCVTDHREVEAALRGLLGQASPARRPPARHEVKVCYEAPFAPDLGAVAEQTGLSPEAVIAAHLSGNYRVFLYGFAPGYAYLAGVPQEIRLDRKTAPVPNVPAGSVIIAGAQSLVTTLRMPTGWWVIGRSPTAILTGNDDRPFLFDVGDEVSFCRIPADRMQGAANG